MKRILSLIICMSIVISSMGIVAFADTNHWSYEYIKGMLQDGVVTGDQNGNLNLDNLITRAEFAKTVNKYFGYTVKADNGFNDVSVDKWYYEDMLIAKGTGYMIGDANGNANADSYITRAEAFVIIARLLGLDDDNSVSFTDADEIPAWAKGKIGALVTKGIISGYTDGTIKANGSITRAEAFTVISKNERTTMPTDANVSEDVGNTSSMTHTNSGSVFVNPSTSVGSGGGGGGSSSTVNYANVDLRNFNTTSYDIELYVENASTVTLNFNVGGTSYSKTVNVSSGTNKTNIKTLIEEICVTRQNNGETFVLTSVTANAVSGYENKTTVTNKTFVGDILSEYKVTGVTDNGYDQDTGELKVSWTAVDGITDYVIFVYKTNSFTSENKVAQYSVTSATNGTVPVSTDFDTYNFGDTYYISVAVDKQGLVGTANQTDYIEKTAGFAGTGVEGDPYIVSSLTHLKKVSENLSAHYKQVADIEEELTAPISTSNFTGVYDGGNRTIKLNITDNRNYVGMFPQSYGATFKNIKLTGSVTNASTSASSVLGALVGKAMSTNIENCHNAATVSGFYKVGGLVGWFEAVKGENHYIKNCSNTGDITGTGQAVAGIAAYVNNYTKVSGCRNSGTVTSDITGNVNYACLGGIVGWSKEIQIYDCHNAGLVQAIGTVAKENVGGIVGLAEYCTVQYCSNTGDVVNKLASYPGGIIGRILISRDGYAEWDGIVLSNSFNAGNISSPAGNYAAGLIGRFYSYGSSTYDSVVKNNFNAGKITATKNPSSGLGYTDAAANTSTNLKFTGFYSSTDSLAIGRTTTLFNYTCEDVYVLNGSSYSATAEEIKALTSKSGSVFNDSTLWTPSTTYWKYPQIVGNIYTPVVKPVDLDVSYSNGKYILTWDCNLEGTVSYTVYVNNNPLTPTTEKSQEINIAGLKDVEIYVVANEEGTDYTSDTIKATDCVPGSLSVDYADKAYTLTWDCLAEIASFEVFVDGTSQGTTTEESKVINIDGLVDIDVYVTATVNGREYKSTSVKVTDYVPYNLIVEPESGKFVLKWKCELSGAAYKVYVGDDQPIETTSTSQEVNIAGKFNVPIYVTATKDNVTYVSETITATGDSRPYGLTAEIENAQYKLTWNCVLENAKYTVYIDDVAQTPQSSLSLVIDPELKTDISVYVVANDGTTDYTSDTVKINGLYFGGAGTAQEPYLIATAKQFNNTFGSAATDAGMEAHYYLISDIDLSTAGYVPAAKLFKGTLSGYNHNTEKLEKKEINLGGTTDSPVLRTPVDGIFYTGKTLAGGIINEIQGATVSYLSVKGCIKASAATTGGFGGIVGGTNETSDYSTLSYLDSYVTVIGNSSESASGIIGFTRGPADNCRNFGNISGGKYAGGIIGFSNSTKESLTLCFNAGNISGISHTGGIIGSSYYNIINCGNIGNISSTTNSCGGIFGYNSTSNIKISGCFNTGTVTGTGTSTCVGGIAGRAYWGSSSKPTRGFTLENCYNIGTVSGEGPTGSAVGDIANSNVDGTPVTINCFYDLKNASLKLFSTSKTGTVENPVAYILNGTGDALAYNANEAQIKALVDNTVWEIKDVNGYVFPTLVNNPYDDNLSAFSQN